MIFGFHLSRDCPSWTSVMAALNMGVSTKNLEGSTSTRRGQCSACPRSSRWTTAPEFHSRSLRAAAGQLRMELRYMPRGKPHLKGGIERTMGVDRVATFSSFPARPHVFESGRPAATTRSAGRAAATLREAERAADDLFRRHRPQSAPMGSLLGRTPLQTWEALVGFGVRMPPNADDLDGDPIARRSIAPSPASASRSLAWSTSRRSCRASVRRVGHIGKLLMVKIDPNDIGSMLVWTRATRTGKGKWIICALHLSRAG